MFTQLLLADEINRASPKAQSALLEAMEERQVSVEGVTHALPEPFFVVATQNPHEQIGTYGLPESQLDRFLMRVSLGYPDPAAERRVLLQGERRELLQRYAHGAARTAEVSVAAARGARRVRLRLAARLPAGAGGAHARASYRSGSRRGPRKACCAPRRPGR